MTARFAWRGLGAAAGLAAVMGCATWTYDRPLYAHMCREADWEQLYYDEAIQYGDDSPAAQARLQVLTEACPYHKIQPPAEAKPAALERVKREFCPPEKGFSWGRSGRLNPKVCTDGFTSEWRRGYREFLTLQLAYLKNKDPYHSLYQKYLEGMNVPKKNYLQHSMARAEAEKQATEELKIKRMGSLDETERRKLISSYSRELAKLR